MTLSELTVCEMTLCEMTLCEMTLFEMTLCEMTLYKISLGLCEMPDRRHCYLRCKSAARTGCQCLRSPRRHHLCASSHQRKSLSVLAPDITWTVHLLITSEFSSNTLAAPCHYLRFHVEPKSWPCLNSLMSLLWNVICTYNRFAPGSRKTFFNFVSYSFPSHQHAL